MVTQVTEPAALDLKTLPVTVPPVPRVTQRSRVDNSSPVCRSMNQSQNSALSYGPDSGSALDNEFWDGLMAEKDSAEVAAYLGATAGLGNT